MIFAEFATLKKAISKVFRQLHSTGFTQRQLDYFFISNFLQESTKATDTLAAFSKDLL